MLKKYDKLMHELNMTRGYGLLEDFLAKERSGLANRLIPAYYRKGSLLDIGCGSFPFFLLHTKFEKKYGIDKIIRRGYDRSFFDHKIAFIHHDAERTSEIPFKNNFFDVVTMLAVLEHIKPTKVERLFEEINRVLKEKGKCIITTPAVCAGPLLRYMAKLRLVSPVEIAEHKYIYNFNSIVSLLGDAGFEKSGIKTGRFFLNTWVIATK